ncbi:hypothetical protein G9A89_019883 [Geosiphon pyriformis]|nr:hypothetical protein G9A89_019883 [Geosiphon pyriformis]
MTDFGLTSGYHVHDGLDQGEVFFPLLWHIFYDPLLCKVKQQKNDVGPLNILGSGEFLSVCDCFSRVETGCLSVYTDGSLRNLGMVSCKAGTAAFFEDISLDLGVGVSGLMSSTLAELQAIALALECIFSSSLVCLFSDSQFALDACKLKLGLLHPDFRSQCWIKYWHIVNLIHRQNLRVSWHKVKGHSGVEENEQTNVIAGSDSFSSWFLSLHLDEHFLVANSIVISGNSRRFVQDIFYSISCAH